MQIYYSQKKLSSPESYYPGALLVVVVTSKPFPTIITRLSVPSFELPKFFGEHQHSAPRRCLQICPLLPLIELLNKGRVSRKSEAASSPESPFVYQTLLLLCSIHVLRTRGCWSGMEAVKLNASGGYAQIVWEDGSSALRAFWCAARSPKATTPYVVSYYCYRSPASKTKLAPSPSKNKQKKYLPKASCTAGCLLEVRAFFGFPNFWFSSWGRQAW